MKLFLGTWNLGFETWVLNKLTYEPVHRISFTKLILYRYR